MFVKPKTCSRCSGSGVVESPVDFGRCFKCMGAGEVESDRATLATRKAFSANRTALGHAAFAAGHAAHSGLSLLEEREPVRLAKAVESFAAGRTDVIDALIAYYHDPR